MTTTLKLHFSPENIRKITLRDELRSFADFIQFLNENYQKYLVDKEYLVQYVDEDNDVITVETQLEWEELINSISGTRCSVYIKIQEPPKRVALKKFKMGMMRGGCRRWRGGEPQDENEKKEWEEKRAQRMERRSGFMHRKALRLMDIGNEKTLSHAKIILMNMVKSKPEDSIAWYNLACCESLLGNVGEAIETLRTAIATGYNNVEHMKKDVDFDNIRNTEEFQQLIQSLSPATLPLTKIAVLSPLPEIVPLVPLKMAVVIPEEVKPEPIQEEPTPEPIQEQPTYNPIQIALEEMGFNLGDLSKFEEICKQFSYDANRIVEHIINNIY